MYPKSIVVAVILFSLLLLSCHRKERVPEETFFAMLREIHMTTGLLNFSDVKEKYSAKDSLTIYTEIYERFGYSQEVAENTFNYYFIKKNKRLKSFYNSFLGELAAEQVRLVDERLKEFTLIKPDIWAGEVSYFFPNEEAEEKGYFEHQLLSEGVYTISFTISVEPSDQTFQPHMSLYIKPFGTLRQDEEAELITTIRYAKDGNDYNFSVPVAKRERSVMMLYGYFFDTSGNPANIHKNAHIRDIKIDYAPL